MTEQVRSDSAIEISSEQLRAISDRYRAGKGNTITVLQDIQDTFGYIPEQAVSWLSNDLGIPESSLFGVATFYSFFTLKPRGKYHIRVCMGTACYVKNAEKIMQRIENELKTDIGEVTPDKKFSYESVRCIGACGLAPVVVVNEDTYGDVNPLKTSKILKSYKKKKD
jgi:NADH-quinone oxidoreductase subunit E/NADP-reducing hydrogenase subunit HndA